MAEPARSTTATVPEPEVAPDVAPALATPPLAALMKTYAGPIYGYLTRCGVGAPERDDLFQEIFCKVHTASAGGTAPESVRAWIFAIAVNTVRSHFRRAKVRSVVELVADPERDTESSPTERPDRAAEARETASFIESQIARLPLEQREVLLLCCVQGLDMKDAASALGVPVNTVKTRLRRARLSLAEAAERRRLRLEREGS